MTLTGRDTLIDRPEIVNRGGSKDGENNEESTETHVETLGNGGGPVVHGLEFEKGHYNIVAASNLTAVLATGTDGGEEFRDAFTNAALQLYRQVQKGIDIRDIVRFSMASGVAEINLSDAQIEGLRDVESQEREEEQKESADGDVEEDVDEEIEEIEEDVDEVDDEEPEDSESEDEGSDIEVSVDDSEETEDDGE